MFDAAIASGRPLLVLSDVDPARLAARSDRPGDAVPPPPEDLRELVLIEVARVLGYATPSEVDISRSLAELGFDSLTAVELRNRLAAATGLTLAASVAFDHPTIPALVNHLRAGLAPQDATTALGVLTELTKLESAVADLAMDGVARMRLVESLTRILSKVQRRADVIEAAQDDFFDLTEAANRRPASDTGGFT
jgi:acyl carrier protein